MFKGACGLPPFRDAKHGSWANERVSRMGGWTSMGEHGRGSNHTAGPDEAIRDCACHGTLHPPSCGRLLLVKIQIKRAFPAASNIALLLCSLRSIHYFLQLVLYALASVLCMHVPICLLVDVRRDAEAVCHNASRVILGLNARLHSQLKWFL